MYLTFKETFRKNAERTVKENEEWLRAVGKKAAENPGGLFF